MVDWRPSASLKHLQLRARVLGEIREFFRQRQVLEVDTPLLRPTAATDPHLDSIRVNGVFRADARDFYLQTSPEFAMKMLLAAGSGPIYQLGKAFRRDERGSCHNPEFTMLEWYRPGFDEQRLMDEVAELIKAVSGREVSSRLTYRELFQLQAGLDPHSCSEAALQDFALQHIDFAPNGYSRDELLHLLLAEVIEPRIQDDCFVHDFPACMAALARIANDAQGARVARRFELFMDGMEIANGYWELTDATEQRQRFAADLMERRRLGRDSLPVDERLLAALEAGLPDCAGVALGVDRLLMVMTGTRRIDEVLTAPLERP
jgi:lysyl-tRNA synthetase class 2